MRGAFFVSGERVSLEVIFQHLERSVCTRKEIKVNMDYSEAWR